MTPNRKPARTNGHRSDEFADQIASETIENADGHVKAAVVMLLAECDFAEATELLDRASGSVRDAIVSAGTSGEEA